MKRRGYLAGVFAIAIVAAGLVPATGVAHAATPITVAVGDLSLVETDVGTAAVKFPFVLSAPAPTPIYVTYAAWNGTATSPSDYKSEAGTITFNVGQVEKEATIKINGDAAVEGNETINVTISSVAGATATRNWGLLMIVDNDANGVSATPEVTVGYPTAQEGNVGERNTDLPIRLSRPSTGTVTVGLHDGCGVKNIVFPPGQTLKYAQVPIVPDFNPNPTYAIPTAYWMVGGPAVVPYPYSGLAVRDDDGTAPAVGATVRASETARGAPAQYSQWGCSDVNPQASQGSISANGRYVSFTSQAKNLVPGDLPGFDIYVKDIWTGAIERATSGIAYQERPIYGIISPDGRYVVYELMNFPGHEAWGRLDVYLYDRVTKTTETLIPDELPGEIYVAGNPSISADNRYVAFQSTVPFAGDEDPSCPPGPSNCPTGDVFVRDRVLGTTTLVSKHDDGSPGAGWFAAISADGSTVAYGGESTPLPDGSMTYGSIRVADLATGHTEPVSVNSAEEPFLGWGTPPARPGISANGQQISFVAEACNLGNPCPYGLDRRTSMQVYVRDRSTGTTTPMSFVRPSVFEQSALQTSISADGRYVTFASNDPALVPGWSAACNEKDSVVQRDRVTGVVVRVSQAMSGACPNATSTLFDLSTFSSANGSYVVYTSAGSDIVKRDNNIDEDVFVKRLR